MKNESSRFIKYPLYPSPTPWYERLMVTLRFGGIIRCTVCGAISVVYVAGNNLRDTCKCLRCRATNRHRQIAYIACQSVGQATKSSLSSLKDFAGLGDFVIYNTEARGPLHNQLSRMRGYICSEYFGPSHKSGDLVGNVMHQDLMDLSFADESIDLLISSEVFEHIPRPYRAHEEVYRVLKTGGRHIFTVPFHQTDFLDDERTVMEESENTGFLKEPIYHLDPLRPEGTLVYTIFALEMLVKLRRIGFRTNLYQLQRPWHGIFGPNAIVFEAVKD